METWFPGGLFGLLFLWGLWEWSKRIRRKKKGRNETGAVVAENADEKPDKISGILYLVIGSAIAVLIVVFIVILS